MNLRYTLGSFVVIPLLPFMYFQGKKIRASVPKLPEAGGLVGISVGTTGKVLRILAIGESTIAGVGVATHREGFTGTFADELAKKLNAEVQWRVYARSGYTAQRIREKTLPRITEQSVDLVIIGLGGNDAFTLNSPRSWKADIKKLVADIRVKFGQIPIAFMNMPPIKAFPAFTPLIKFTIGNLVEILGEELAQVILTLPNTYYYSRRITLEDWINRLSIQAEPSDFFSDGVHPSKLTYQVWAKDFARYLTAQDEIRLQLEQQLQKN